MRVPSSSTCADLCLSSTACLISLLCSSALPLSPILCFQDILLCYFSDLFFLRMVPLTISGCIAIYRAISGFYRLLSCLCGYVGCSVDGFIR